MTMPGFGKQAVTPFVNLPDDPLDKLIVPGVEGHGKERHPLLHVRKDNAETIVRQWGDKRFRHLRATPFTIGFSHFFPTER